MKKIFGAILLLFLASCGNGSSTSVSTFRPDEVFSKAQSRSPLLHEDGAYREGELLVKFKPLVMTTSAMKIHRTVGASVMKRFSLIPNLERVKLSEGRSVTDAIAAYLSDPNVEYAEPNYIRRASETVPNDPLFSQQWGLRNIGQSARWTPGADIKGAEAWDIDRGNGDIVIAVIDTGIDYTHPDLAANIWTNAAEVPDNGIDDDGNGKIDDVRGWNFVAGSNDPMDDNGHGTHVAGIVGAAGNNGTGVSGLMWSVRLMPLKILGAEGEGTVADEIEAILYAVARGVKAINLSLAGAAFTQAEADAITAANTAGVLVVAAAGNGGGPFCDGGLGNNNDLSPCYPASYSAPNVTAVAASDPNDRLASFSNYGATSVHVAAPGVEILSSFPLRLLLSGYRLETGTSMSTPFVSGLAGLLSAHYPHLSAAQIRGLILRYADTLPALQGRILAGGRINAFRSLSALLAPSGLSSSQQQAGAVVLSWRDNATGEDGYTIERRSGAGSYSLLSSAGPDTSSYSDTAAAEGAVNVYRVKASASLPNPPATTKVLAESAPAEISVTTPLNPPTGLSATAFSSAQVNLSWTDNSQAEDGYRIERKTADSAFAEIGVVGQGLSTFSDSGLSPSTTYAYRVRAFNSIAGDSSFSNEASVTTPDSGASQPPAPGGGGGGCSVAAKNTPATASDITFILVPLVIIAARKLRKP